MSLCKSIETLSMAYLDDELAAEERHELEAHLTECASCRAHLDGERAELELVRRALVAPVAPDVMTARIGRALDDEDRVATRAQRRRWAPLVLPGSAILAAAAAIVVFVGVGDKPAGDRVGSVVQNAARLPLEVQGASTGTWLRQHFEPSIEPPQFGEPGSQLAGARLLPHSINGHNAALLSYRVSRDGNPFVLSILVVRDLRSGEMTDGSEVRVGGRTLHVVEEDGLTAVTYVDGNHLGYMFMAPELSASELVWLVGRTNVGALPQ